MLRIRESKFGKSRLVPLHPSAVDALERYDHTRQQLLPDPSTDGFFVSLRGTRVIYECVWPVHRRLCEHAGVGAGSSVRPRIHDHRHSFAVNTLLAWYQQGIDVPSRISWLSTYLGHREPRYTYHYLSAAPGLLAHAARLLDNAAGALMTLVAPTLQAFFTDRLTRQLQASPRHDRLLPRHAPAAALLHPGAAPARQPSKLDWSELNESCLTAFLEHLETDRAQHRPNQQPPAHSDPVAVQVRRARPPRARRRDRAGPGDPDRNATRTDRSRSSPPRRAKR